MNAGNENNSSARPSEGKQPGSNGLDRERSGQSDRPGNTGSDSAQVPTPEEAQTFAHSPDPVI
jgi:hypothetical protein